MKVRSWMRVLVCLVSSGAFVGGCSSPAQPSIVGQWKARAVSTSDSPAAMEVFENGTAVIQDAEGDFYQCKYVRKDNTIVYDNEPLGVAVLTESTLVLTFQDDDDAFVFDRVKD